MTIDHDDELLLEDDPPEATRLTRTPLPGPLSWKVVVVDDDEDVHTVTRLALGGSLVDGYPVRLVGARSAAEARTMLRATPDVALVLLDVVMEADDAGLRLAQWIRGELGNGLVRIVLRTGQPGRAPEASVMARFDIHDYHAKAELSALRLRTAVSGGVRAYRDLRMLTQQRNGLERVIRATATLLGPPDVGTLLGGLLDQITALLLPREHAVFFLARAPLFAPVSQARVVLAASGRFAGLVGAPVERAVPEPVLAAMSDGAASGVWTEIGEDGLFVLDLGDGIAPCLYLEGAASLSDWERRLLNVFCANAALALRDQRRQLARETRLAAAERFVPQALLAAFGVDMEAPVGAYGPVMLNALFVARRGVDGAAAEPRRLLALLAPVATAHGGTVDVRRGDGALLLLPGDAAAALEAAGGLRATLAGAGLAALGVTLARGEITLFIADDSDHREPIASGEPIDLVVALQGLRAQLGAGVLAVDTGDLPSDLAQRPSWRFDSGWGTSVTVIAP